METFLSNTKLIYIIMSAIVFILTYIIKLPIKHFTNKISDECSIKIGNYSILVRRLINTIFVLIPFGLGILCQFLYSHYTEYAIFDIIKGLSIGTSSLSLYAIIERFFGIKLENDNESEEGKIINEAVEEISKDNKANRDDLKNIKDALNKLKKL